MMQLLLLLMAVVLLPMSPAWAMAPLPPDPPGRVGRLAEVVGPVWWLDRQKARWIEATPNRPLTASDRIMTGRDARADVRIGSTTIKLAEDSELEIVVLDDERVRIQLRSGSLALRLRSPEVAAETDFGTEEAWLQPMRGGLYRLDRADDTTHATALRGDLRLVDDAAVVVDGSRRLQLWREGPARELRQRWSQKVDDAFAQRVLDADRDDERTASAAYVSPEMTGWEDLDRHGRWETHPDYGPVWTPMAVRIDWAPYRYGRWEEVRPWGWTWIDEAPWGFAPFHYGRWVSWRSRWHWVPGVYVPRPVYAPALVAWLDGPSASVGPFLGGPTLSWVPLAPWEVFRPAYRVSPHYHERVNTPDHRRWKPQPPTRGDGRTHTYANQGVPNAVTVVSSDVLRPRLPRDEGRPSAERRTPPPPPPTAPIAPLPSRPQPQQAQLPQAQLPSQPQLPPQPPAPMRPPAAQAPAQPLPPVMPQANPVQPRPPAEPPRPPAAALPPQAPPPPPPPVRPLEHLPSRPAPGHDDRASRDTPPPPATSPVRPPPPPVSQPPRPQPQPQVTAPPPPRHAAPAEPKAPPPAAAPRERERDKDKDEPKGRASSK